MRFLADENLEGPVVRRLRAAGHEVLWIREEQPQAGDAEVLRLAEETDRILLTNDKDFAELTYLKRQASAGIVLLRLPGVRSSVKADRLLKVIAHLGDALHGSFTVVTAQATRRRALLRDRSS